MNPVLKFPVSEDLRKKRILSADIRPEPSLRSFTREESRSLLDVARKVHDGTKVLLDLVDSHRDAAREAGVETISIELGSERDNVDRILDTLEESEVKGSDARLTLAGLELLRRTEKLIAEANSNLLKFAGPEKERNLLGSSTVSTDSLIFGSIAFFGVIIVTATVIAIVAGAHRD